jgi:membrane protein implicated in regulation of membrane protease activity
MEVCSAHPLPGLALYAWIDFTRTAHDGLADLGLMLVTLPVTAVGLLLTWALGKPGFVLLPSGVEYYTADAVYFWPLALLTAALLYSVCSALGWRWRRVGRGAQQHQRAETGRGVRDRVQDRHSARGHGPGARAKRRRGYWNL